MKVLQECRKVVSKKEIAAITAVLNKIKLPGEKVSVSPMRNNPGGVVIDIGIGEIRIMRERPFADWLYITERYLSNLKRKFMKGQIKTLRHKL